MGRKGNSSMLTISHISKTFDGIKALNDVSLTLERGKVTALIGPNGAGKTTLFNIINGFIKPDGGRITYLGKAIIGQPPYIIARRGIARTFQVLRLFESLSVLDNLLLSFRENRGEALFRLYFSPCSVLNTEEKNRTKALELIQLVGLTAKVSEPAKELSYGQQKLLSLAMCLAMGGDLLLLDEPVAGVDPEMFRRILSLIEALCRDESKTVCFIEHHMGAVAEVADRVIFMDDGKIIDDGTYQQVAKSQSSLRAYIR